LPGVVSLGIFLNPMFEAMPRIRKMGHLTKSGRTKAVFFTCWCCDVVCF
jgi:hypothetical protein